MRLCYATVPVRRRVKTPGVELRRHGTDVCALRPGRLCEPLSWSVSGQDCDTRREGLRQTATVVIG